MREVFDALSAIALAGFALLTIAVRPPLFTGHSDLKTAVRATRLGAFDYLTKPVDTDELVAVVGRALEKRALEAEVEDLRRQIGDAGGLAKQMGPSDQIKQVIEQVKVVAADAPCSRERAAILRRGARGAISAVQRRRRRALFFAPDGGWVIDSIACVRGG